MRDELIDYCLLVSANFWEWGKENQVHQLIQHPFIDVDTLSRAEYQKQRGLPLTPTAYCSMPTPLHYVTKVH